MLQHKAYVYRIYPDKKQETLIARTIGSSRFVFNHFLELWNKEYEETGKGLNYFACCKLLTKMKRDPETIWLREVDKCSLQNSLRNLSDAFSRFFKGQNEHPQFKSKKSSRQSYTTQFSNNNISISGNHLKLPKLGLVKFADSREMKGRILNATVRRKPSGKFFVSILCEEEICELPKTDSTVGIDLGIIDFAVLSDGSRNDNNHFTRQMEERLRREQRKLARRALASEKRGIPLSEARNYQKQRRKVARLYEKVANQRKEYLNKLSTEIVKNHDIICIEDLNVKGMMRNRKLVKSISDVSWTSLVSKLQYKADWYGKEVIRISRWFPSSQICSECGHKDGKKPLHVREWTCPVCQSHHDRDVNAARNILAEGLRIRALTPGS
ncbi:IS200/IS605 family element RNA-guided endonuclease TnpB [Youngiibacter multivorans]|uniref:IS200/IS605 family element RNA-guided endonuclease TnpB n=1 Tax=Youngiibacter multivorans TaxID=937251 RepID=UPI001AE755A4|nr:IS200/IS605 family element RNA-guided endonuclease TnpB [Youngiibacter multivorans]